MKVAIQLTAREEAKALPILLRQSPGMIPPDRTYVIREDAARLLRDASIRFTNLSREAIAEAVGIVISGDQDLTRRCRSPVASIRLRG